jgi:rhodanese-related sulfurtransferase
MRTNDEGSLGWGILLIVLVGTALGVGFNMLGLAGEPAWGLSWIAEDKLEQLEQLDLEIPDAAPAVGGGYGQISDPMAVGLGSQTALPEIPELDRPVEISLQAVKLFADASGAVIIDAREDYEFADGHIPGAINMPYDEVSAEPERLANLDAGGRPIIVYCGGGTCELSLTLAWDLISAGQSKVVVFMGGYPEWQEAGYPVAGGS